jgi:pimeloyl-ACP methyl ester carboxylesterase
VLHLMLAAALAAASPAANAYAVPGRRVSVQGHRLNLVCEGSGRPVVVLDAGLGDWSPTWIRIQRPLASHSTVCAYDRAGYGFSGPATSPRTSFAIARELHELLHAAKLPAPYLLVGHSFGGLNVQEYAQIYRGEVAGLVLVDDTPADFSIPAALKPLMDGQLAAAKKCAAKPRPACFDVLWGISSQPDNGVTPRLVAAVKAQARRPWPYDAVASEMEHLTQSQREVRASERSFGALPMIVLTATTHSEDHMPPGLRAGLAGFEPAWRRAHRRIAALSTRGRYELVRSDHYIQFDRPNVVIDAVDEVLAEIRHAPAGNER